MLSDDSAKKVIVDALLASIFVSPEDHGLTKVELANLAAQRGVPPGTLGDELRYQTWAQYDGRGRYRISPNYGITHVLDFHETYEEDPRNYDAFCHVYDTFEYLKQQYGKNAAKLGADEVIANGVAKGLRKLEVQAALCCFVWFKQLEEQPDGELKLKGMYASPRFQREEQGSNSIRRHNVLRGAYELLDAVRQVISERNQQGGPPAPAPGQAVPKATRTSMNKKLFLSHASSDKALVDDFVDDILEGGIGIPPQRIFCTSRGDQGIKPGADFVKSIHENLEDANWVLALLTPSFWESSFCMCELGAAWIKTETLIPLVGPGCDYSDLPQVIDRTQGIKLASGEKLDQLRDYLTREMGLEARGTEHWNRKKQKFLERLKS